jgi:hypothetical protein
LHVLSTPPAFVLSQDQTLREELLRRAASDPLSQRASAPNLASPIQPVTEEPRYTTGSGAHDGVGLGTAERSALKEPASDGVEPGHTISTEGSVEGAHAVEFSKTVAPLQEGDAFLSGASVGLPAPERTAEYSARLRLTGGDAATALGRRKPPATTLVAPAEPCPPGSGRADYETIWTVTVRRRGRSSKSIRTICCHVPRARAPSTSGIVSEGPIRAARRWAWEFVSWLSRLWS